MAKTKTAIHIDKLRVRRGRREVIHGLTVSIPQGSITGLLGPSGCGKTTLMRSIIGVQRGVHGTITIMGKPAGSPRLRHMVGYVTQAPSVYSDLTVRQNLHYFRSVLKAPKTDVDRVIQATRLEPQQNQLVKSLSEGQHSRASLAAALLGTPDVLILDEPTVGLDPVLRSELWEVMRNLANDGVTLLVSSHVLDEASHCDRLLLMRDGNLIADSTLNELLKKTGAPNPEAAFLALVSNTTQPEEARP